jgi:sulfopyruvate decarboxylase TPP-binding subunit
MKVFISHSSTDKWIARQISMHLAAIGIDSFLDEKEIETGDSIDEAIQTHLADCDELLMLLSPRLWRAIG